MIDLNFAIKEVELIIAALRKLPMEVSEELVVKIRQSALPQIQQAALQAQAQAQAQNTPAPAPEPAPEPTPEPTQPQT